MRIQFKRSGGIAYFPGLSRPVTLDSSDLPPAEAEALTKLIEATHFFDLPAQIGAPARGAADYQTYTITVEDGGRSHTVQAFDPVENSQVKALLDYLRARPKGS